MVQDRNLTSHAYNRSTAEQVREQVGARYLPCFRELRLVIASACRPPPGRREMAEHPPAATATPAAIPGLPP